MRVAVLGAGYAGLTVARKLERSLPGAVDLVVVTDEPYHLVQHELHRLIRHPDLADVITVPLDEVLTRATVREATVTAVDQEAGVATLDADEGEETLEYDYGVVCLGAETDFYDLDGLEAHATPLKRIEHAEQIRADAFEAAGGQAVVGGAGLSGIQVAGELVELSEAEDLDLDVTLVEMADQIAPGFDATLAAAIRRELEARGVTVETGVTVDAADGEAVHLNDGDAIPADVFVWAGGIRGPDALGRERPRAQADLRLSERTFVAGDVGRILDVSGTEVPATAQTATREAVVVARNIQRLVESTGTFAEPDEPINIPVSNDPDAESGTDHEEGPADADETDEEDTGQRLESYELNLSGWVVSVGDGAVAKVGPLVYSGEPAKATKAAIGAQHLGGVGAIHKASLLVAEELGWPTTDPFGVTQLLDDAESGAIPLPSGAPNETMTEFIQVAVDLSETLAMGETIDLTPLTRQADVSYPQNVMNAFGRVFVESVGQTLTGLASRESGGSGTEIDVTADDDEQTEFEAGGSTESGGDEIEVTVDDEAFESHPGGASDETDDRDSTEADDGDEPHSSGTEDVDESQDSATEDVDEAQDTATEDVDEAQDTATEEEETNDAGA